MKLPPIHIDHLDIKLSLDNLLLNVLYVKFGYFYSSMHAHSHSLRTYELHYIPSGYGMLVADGKNYEITPGTLFVTGPNVVHEQITKIDDPMAEYCIFFEILSDDFVSSANRKVVMKEPMLQELLKNTPFWIGKDCGNLMSMFEVLAIQLTSKRIGWHQMVTNLLEIIIIHSIQQYTVHNVSKQPTPLKTLDDNRLVIIENSFLYHFASITLEQLADMLKLSPRQTQRAVQKQFGMSFQDKKLQSRMQAANSLLQTTRLSISEIAAQVGFASLEQFSNAFKKYYGMTASQFRKSKQV